MTDTDRSQVCSTVQSGTQYNFGILVYQLLDYYTNEKSQIKCLY